MNLFSQIFFTPFLSPLSCMFITITARKSESNEAVAKMQLALEWDSVSFFIAMFQLWNQLNVVEICEINTRYSLNVLSSSGLRNLSCFPWRKGKMQCIARCVLLHAMKFFGGMKASSSVCSFGLMASRYCYPHMSCLV